MYNQSHLNRTNITHLAECNIYAAELCLNISSREEAIAKDAEDADDAIWILSSTFIIFTMQSGRGSFTDLQGDLCGSPPGVNDG